MGLEFEFLNLTLNKGTWARPIFDIPDPIFSHHLKRFQNHGP